ncbi:MAG: hypothetical protein U0T32_04385 [Chitinophagales bacterium]
MVLTQVNAQRVWETRKGIFRSQGNLGGGYMIKQKTVSAYCNGEMELFFDDRFAYTGAVCFSFLTLKKNQTGVKANHAVFAGANYHFLKPQRFDPYIGLTPGAGLVQARYKEGEELKNTPYTVVPLLSVQVGCNFYVASFMHFFLKVQGVTGQMFKYLSTPQRLDEIKFMGGLGCGTSASGNQRCETHGRKSNSVLHKQCSNFTVPLFCVKKSSNFGAAC